MPELRHIVLDESTPPPEIIDTDMFTTTMSETWGKPQVVMQNIGDDATKQCGVFDSNIKRINKKTAQLARCVRRGLLDGRGINLKGLPVPKAKGPVRAKKGGVQRETSSAHRPPAPSRRPVKQRPSSVSSKIPAAAPAEISPPVPVAFHPLATAGVRPGPPPHVHPMNNYQLLRSNEPTPITNGPQTTLPSVRVDEKQTPTRHHADDARRYDGARGHPQYRRHAAHVLDYNEHDRYGHAAAPDENTRHGQAGGDMLQTHTLEPRGYGGRPLASQVEFQRILDRDQEPPFRSKRQPTYSRSLNLVGKHSIEFAPTYKSLTMRHNSTRIEHSASYGPPHADTTGYQTYGNMARGNTSPHRPSSASTASSTSIGAIDAPYELTEVVNTSFGHLFAAPAPAPMQYSANQYQDVIFPSADRLLSLQQPRWTPVNFDASQATIYRQSYDNNNDGSFSQQAQVYDAGFGVSEPQARLGIDYTGTEQWRDSQRASIPHSTAAHAQVAYDPSFENANLDPRQCSVSPSGRQQEHTFGSAGLPPYDHRGAHHRFMYDAGPVQTQPAHEFPLWTAREAGDPLANSALELAQLAHHREVVSPSRPRSMIAHGGSIMAYPTLNLGHSPIANPFYEFRYDVTEDAPGYRMPEHANGSSPYAFPQGTFFRRANVPSGPQATNRGLSLFQVQ